MKSESSAANLALVRLDARVGAAVRLQAALLRKGLSTEVAFVGSLARVGESVSLQMFCQRERLPASLTLVVLLASVNKHMTLQRVVAYETFVTRGTSELLQLFVFPGRDVVWDVHLEGIHVVRGLRHEDTPLFTSAALVFQMAKQARGI